MSRRLRTALPAAPYRAPGDASGIHTLGERLSHVPELVLTTPVRLNVVCFTLAERPTWERVHALADAIAAGGETFVTPTVLHGTHALRAAFSNWRTTETDVERVVEAVRAGAARAEP
ncbi:hypothetical protein [Streptomyces neyagawaensis]|uniref:hypothetical protein n=1 Tax=Streptomyces neyagawaensis TaxID=42238 RepID=UPI003F4CC486